MRKSKRDKPPSIYPPSHHHHHSRETSPRCSSVFEDWDADDEDFMFSCEFPPSRPLSMAVPQQSGPYCPRRPTLQEVLANAAPPPWTLTAFMAYLSQNHCLETLEFTMDASRYRKHYNTMLESNGGVIRVDSEGCEYVRMLWQKLLDAYLTPNGPREVNLPSDVRDILLSLPNQVTPPHPSALESAVQIIYELMNDSVLIPFLNSLSPTRGSNPTISPWTSSEEMPDLIYHGAAEDRSMSPSRNRSGREGSPPNIEFEKAGSPRPSRQSHLSAALSRSTGNRLSAYLTNASTVSGSESNELTDDSGNSPATSTGEPMTPPTTPPTSESLMSPSTSPKNIKETGWKKMGAKLGWKKSRSGHTSSASTSIGKQSSNREDYEIAQ